MSSLDPPFPLVEGAQLQKEQLVLVGMLLSFVTYGFTVLSFVLCLRSLSKRPQASSKWMSTCHVCFMFILISAYTVLKVVGKVEAFTTYRQYPGGPTAWIRVTTRAAPGVAGTLCAMFSTWLFDAFLMYRAAMMYRTRRYILFLPLSLYVGSITTGCILIFKRVHSQESSLWTNVPLGVPYFIVSGLCSFSTVVLIAGRLLLYRYLVQRVVGSETRHNAPYTPIFAILVESAGLYGIFAGAFVVSYALQSSIARLIIPTLCNIRGTALFLILHRATTQKAPDSGSCANNIDSTAARPVVNLNNPNQHPHQVV